MANYACMAIGINRYQFLPPLSYGQADAQVLRQFLVDQANLSASECLLMTDTSPLVSDLSTYPSRDNMLSWLEGEYQQSNTQAIDRATNWRWFFFSGYGVSWQQVDYLMPIDGNPDDIPGTGIPVRSLFTALKAQGGDNILVLLDINRSLGFYSEAPVGTQIVELARQMGITLVLSSQLDQFSHEAAALGNGLFTAALLEALRYYHTDITLEHLEQYLHVRLPELSQHHWRPIQTPLAIIPSENYRQQRIFPTVENPPANQTAVSPSSTFSPRTRLDSENTALPVREMNYRTQRTQEAIAQDYPNGSAASVRTGTASAVEARPIPPTTSTTTATSSEPTSIPGAMVHHPSQKDDPNQTSWRQQLLLWGSATLVLAIMIAAVVLRNRDAFMNRQAVSPVAQVSPTTSTQLNPSSSNAFNRRRKLSASRQTLPPTRLQANQAALEQAKRLLRPNQASLFNKAIAQAHSVKPTDPLYQQARQGITRWSGVILDIAEGRAEKGSYETAITVAQLVPKDDPSIYAKAQQAMKNWQALAKQEQQNQTIIQAAKKQIQPNQASSYSRAIATLSKIQPDEPGDAQAQQLTVQWSRTIYLIAQSRAAQGNIQGAIQTAAFVPEDTPSYDAAQKAIAKWQQDRR